MKVVQDDSSNQEFNPKVKKINIIYVIIFDYDMI